MKKLIIASIVIAVSALSQAKSFANITEGIVIEGDSLPIGIALGDTKTQIETVISEISEFDLDNPDMTFCSSNKCFYFAELSADNFEYVSVRYENDVATRFTWTFADWETMAGVSLNDLEVLTKEELETTYPQADSIRVVEFRGSKVALIRSFTDGLELLYYPARDRVIGTIRAPF